MVFLTFVWQPGDKTMSPIKSILKEELQRLERLCQKYREEINKLPRGSISEKERKGNSYAYLAFREDGKVRFEYIGNIQSDKVKELRRLVEERRRYEGLMKQAQKNLKELKKLLHERKRKSIS
jgi:hypothetical protein